jgi:uncharacterized membrane protein YcgQ (UPF0703/DUF1980 family)
MAEIFKQNVMKNENKTKIIEIKDKLFIAQTNDIYMNSRYYIGKTIKYEGIFYKNPFFEDEIVYDVIRYGPGCCAGDGIIGFEILWDGEYPKEGDWVEVIGVLEKFGEGNLRLRITSIKVLETRGRERVYQ